MGSSAQPPGAREANLRPPAENALPQANPCGTAYLLAVPLQCQQVGSATHGGRTGRAFSADFPNTGTPLAPAVAESPVRMRGTQPSAPALAEFGAEADKAWDPLWSPLADISTELAEDVGQAWRGAFA